MLTAGLLDADDGTDPAGHDLLDDGSALCWHGAGDGTPGVVVRAAGQDVGAIAIVHLATLAGSRRRWGDHAWC